MAANSPPEYASPSGLLLSPAHGYTSKRSESTPATRVEGVAAPPASEEDLPSHTRTSWSAQTPPNSNSQRLRRMRGPTASRRSVRIPESTPTPLSDDSPNPGTDLPTPPTSLPLPCNYVKILREPGNDVASSYKSTFVIDPELRIPQNVLCGISDGDRDFRRNLEVTVEEGSLDVDVFLIGGEDNADTNPVYKVGMPIFLKLALTTQSRGIKSSRSARHFTYNEHPLIARIHAPPHRLPFHLTISASQPSISNNKKLTRGRWNRSPICVHLPRTFCGPISLSIDFKGPIHDHIQLSPAVQEGTVLLNETAQTRSYFLRTPELPMNTTNEWQGDSVKIKYGIGDVYILFTDEAIPPGAVPNIPSVEQSCCCCQ